MTHFNINFFKKLIFLTLVGQYSKMPLSVKDIEYSDIISTIKQSKSIVDTVLPRISNKNNGVNTYTVVNGEIVDMVAVGNLNHASMAKSKNGMNYELKKLNMRIKLADKLKKKNQSNL
jgi:hypothetical protein